jgi:hypothetical protein
MLRPKLRQRLAQQFVELFGRESQSQTLVCDLPQLLQQSAPVSRGRIFARVAGDERPLAVPHFEQPLTRQLLVHSQPSRFLDSLRSAGG